MKFKQNPDGYWMPVPEDKHGGGIVEEPNPAANTTEQEVSGEGKRPVGRPRKPRDE